MIKKIEMYDVKFGDSFLISGSVNARTKDRYRMLVDCGCKNKKVNLDFAVNDLNKIMKGKTPNIGMISHLHEDHMKGIKYLNKHMFDIFYLPNFFTEEYIAFMIIGRIALARQSPLRRFAINVINTVPNLIDSMRYGGRITFVQKGDTINDDMNVLWPDTGINFFDTYLGEMNEIEDFGHILTIAIRYARIYIRLVTPIVSTPINEDTVPPEILIDNIASLMRSAEVELTDIDALHTKEFNDEFKEAFKNVMNDTSIVFKKVNSNNRKENILFLGDISEQVYHNYIKNQVQGCKYNYIKVAHHGTKLHHVSDLPECSHLLISNGKFRDWYITEDLVTDYPKCQFICTNNEGCSYHRKHLKDCNDEYKGRKNRSGIYRLCGVSGKKICKI